MSEILLTSLQRLELGLCTEEVCNALARKA